MHSAQGSSATQLPLSDTDERSFSTSLVCKKSRVKNVCRELYAIAVLSLPRPEYPSRNVARDDLNAVMQTRQISRKEKIHSINRKKTKRKKSRAILQFRYPQYNRIRQRIHLNLLHSPPIATVPNQSVDPICNPPGPTPSHVTTRSHARKT